MTTFFCPSCWAEVPEEEDLCRVCGCRISAYLEGKSYSERLIKALEHPEPTTPVRAAYILGMRKEPQAVPALAWKANATSDVFLALACVEALARIGTSEALEQLGMLSKDSRALVAQKAREMMRSLAKRESEKDPF